MTVPWSQLSRDERRLRVLRSWRLLAPTLFTIATLLVMLLPLRLHGPYLPQLGLLGVSFWAINRPGQMPPAAAFVIGLVQDLWLGAPLGVNAMALMIVAVILAGQHLVFASRPFSFSWWMMVPIAFAYSALLWLLTLLVFRQTDMTPLLVQAGTTVLAYPLVTLLHARLQRRIVDPYLAELG